MGKIKGLLFDLRRHWQRPRKNEYVSYKEVFNFCVGGMGIKTVSSILGYMSLASTCMLFGVVYGLSPRHFVILTVITNVISIVKTPFVSMIVDNTHTKIGKFRPYLLWAGVPTVVGMIGLAYIPLTAPITVKVVLVGVLINLVTITQPLYNNAYMGISQIITPNSGERTKILSISEFLANLGPSIVQFLLPTFAGLLYGEDCMADVRTYRVFVPIFAISGFLLGLLCLYNTRERVLEKDGRKEKVPFVKGVRELSKNRYFWIVAISKFFDGLKGGIGVLLAWVCTYQLGNSSVLGIVQTVVSVGFTPGIILAPLLMKKMGAKYSAFFSHALNFFAAALMLFTFKNGFAFFVIALFFYNFAMGPQYVIQTSILSDGLDYHQDKFGTRIEGFAQNFMLMITTVGTIVSTVIFSAIYEHFGLVAGADGNTDYTILKNPEVREPIIQWVVIVVMIAGLLSAIPYLFCKLSAKDMTEIRERLEYKKFKENGDFEGVDEETVRAAYEQYLLAKEQEHKAEREKAEKEKQAARQKEIEAKEEKALFESNLRKKEEELKEQGVSDKEIKMLISMDKKERKKAIATERKQRALAAMQERKEFNRRKKEFIEKEVAERKSRGEKGYLRILAKEKFEDMIVAENNAESNGGEN